MPGGLSWSRLESKAQRSKGRGEESSSFGFPAARLPFSRNNKKVGCGEGGWEKNPGNEARAHACTGEGIYIPILFYIWMEGGGRAGEVGFSPLSSFQVPLIKKFSESLRGFFFLLDVDIKIMFQEMGWVGRERGSWRAISPDTSEKGRAKKK